MRYDGKRALVLGLGRSGVAAVKLLLRGGASVAAYDRNPAVAPDLDPAVRRLAGEPSGQFDDFDLVVASPGIALAPHPRLLPEVELAARELTAPLVGVTGSNGKSTTTVLIGEMLRRSGLRTLVGGNLGTALSEFAGVPADRVVAELSSFQLEHARELRARVAVLLNLAPDHLDRHGSLEAYGAAKARLAELQRPGDALVANCDDAWASELARRSPARVWYFSERDSTSERERSVSERERPARGARLEGAELVLEGEQGECLRLPREALAWAGRSPLASALAAAAAALAAGAHPSAIAAALEQFEGLPHRAQLVCRRAGVAYVNDSKATNPAAASACLRAQRAPVVWIAGGRNKGLDFGELGAAAGSVRCALLYGEAARELERALAGVVESLVIPAFDDAVHEAARRAREGDVVLLSPACASLDQFSSFEARGARFAELARALPEARPC